MFAVEPLFEGGGENGDLSITGLHGKVERVVRFSKLFACIISSGSNFGT